MRIMAIQSGSGYFASLAYMPRESLKDLKMFALVNVQTAEDSRLWSMKNDGCGQGGERADD